MPRKLRIEYEGAFYHIISRGNTRSRIFKKDSDRSKFLEYLNQIHIKYGVIIHAFCLMGNHYHLLMETPKANLIKAMHKLNTSYTNYYNYHNNRIGHLFSGRYRAILVEKENYAMVLSSYIHLNPVRAGFINIENISDYPWCSYKYYVKSCEKPTFFETDLIINLCGGIKNYQKYVQTQFKKDFKPEKDIKANIILGSKDFFEWVRQKSLTHDWIKTDDKKALNEFYNYKIINSENNIFKIKNVFTDNYSELTNSYKRKIIIYLLKKYTEMTLKEIGKEFEISVSAVSIGVKRFKKELLLKPKIAELVKEIELKL